MVGPQTGRIGHLDLLRGVATLGIFAMNVVSFGLVDPAYFRLDAAGYDTWADQVVGVLGEVFVDQKMMGLFSLLFGASIVLFVDRARTRTLHPVRLSLWRNALLLAIGLAHSAVWDGDVLVVYALCAPLVLAARRLPVRWLHGLAAALLAASFAITLWAQSAVNVDGPDSLGWYWIDADTEVSDAVGVFFLFDGFARALAMMLIGVAVHRSGLLTGQHSVATYRRVAVVGFAIGVPFAVAGVVWQIADDFSYRSALASGALNTVATAPMTLGYLGVIVMWSLAQPSGWAGRLQSRVRAVGQMALTNYLAQTLFGLVALPLVLTAEVPGRAALGAFAAAVCAVELWWSPVWLSRFVNGPIEWLWRVGTYRQRQPFRRPPARPPATESVAAPT